MPHPNHDIAVPSIRLDPDRHQYVVGQGDACSRLNYNAAHGHASQIAALLKRPELSLDAEDYAALSGYAKYRAALDAWAHSPHSMQTYFDPGTRPEARIALEQCRLAATPVRLILGNLQTGIPWLDAHDVVGTVGRSTGMLKVPLLVPHGASHGPAILTANLLAIIHWHSDRTHYRHPAYRRPDLLIQPSDDADLPWSVWHQGVDIADFDDIGKAGAYVAFMRGASIEPHLFQ